MISTISPQQKVDHFKRVDPFLFYTKTMFPIWGDTVRYVYLSLQRSLTNLKCKCEKAALKTFVQKSGAQIVGESVRQF